MKATTIIILLAFFSNIHAQQTAYLVSINKTGQANKQRFTVYKFTKPQQVDSLVAWNFKHIIPVFSTQKALKHTNHFQLQTDYCHLYCEKKAIRKTNKNGKLILRKHEARRKTLQLAK